MEFIYPTLVPQPQAPPPIAMPTDKTSDVQHAKPTRARNKFTKSEDIVLINLVNELGTRDWDIIAARMPNRNARQCRERYLNYLSPNLSHEPWTPEEDRLLEQKLKEFGAKWVNISKYFKNRTDTMLKNRWLVLARRLNTTIQRRKNSSQQQKQETKASDKASIPQPPLAMPATYQMQVPSDINPPQPPKKTLPSLLNLINLDSVVQPTNIMKSFLHNPFDVDQFTKFFTKPIHAM